MINVSGREIQDLIIQSVDNDENTYIIEWEKALTKCIINHFFDVSNWKEFGENNLTMDIYNKYYKDEFEKNHSQSFVNDFIKQLKEEENEIK